VPDIQTFIPATISLPEGVSEHCFLAEVAFFPRVCGFSVGMLVLPVGVDGYINVPCRRMSSLLVSCGVEIHLAFDRVGLRRWASWWRWMVDVDLIKQMSSSDYT